MTEASGAGRDEMRARIESFPWETTPLGAMAQWPASLRTPVRILTTSRFAMWMGWGPELTFLYNDAYARDTLATKHPWALGRPASVVWAEIWADLAPRIRTVMESGEATWDEALRLFLERSGYPEETYHTFSYSPLAGDDGAVTGMLCVVTEETERVISERRLASLSALATSLATATTEAELLDRVTRAVGANLEDLPFTLLYLCDDECRRARLAASTGIDAGHAAAPAVLPLGEGPNDLTVAWPAAELVAARAPIVVDALDTRFASLPTGAWDVAPRRAVLVPIAQRGEDRVAGVLVAALNPYRPFDATYAGFVDLVAGQLAASLANVRSYEAERRRAESLAALDRAKTQFFSNVSHEFRTPLTLMLGPAEDAVSDPDTSAVNRERAAVVHRNALRLLKLVNTLLDFSRIEAGRVDARYEPLDLAALTAEVASAFRSAIERGGVRFVVDTPPLPSDTEPVYVDRDMWEKIVLNLLSNAFKHTFEGDIRAAVRPSADGRHAELLVQDTGTGIPPEQLPRLFERFHRVPNARSRTHEGTGIGLAFVQELVRLHGGTIDVESAEGVGTTFTVRIPFGRAHLPAERVTSATGEWPSIAPQAFTAEAMRWVGDEPGLGERGSGIGAVDATEPRPPIPGSSAHILVADDNADMRDYAGRLLRARGWRVTAVSDGHAALDAVRAEAPDVVLSDVMMPGLDGFGLLRALRADPATRTIPVMLLSARAGEDSKVEGLEAGADDYLEKPFSAQELVARVGAHVALARSRAEATRALTSARDLMRDVFAQAPVAICVMRGASHVFELANPSYEQLAGRRDLVGRAFAEAFPEVEAQGVIAVLDEVYRTGVPFVGRRMPVTFDRTGRGDVAQAYFHYMCYPLVDDDAAGGGGGGGAVAGIIVVAHEITDEVLAQQAADRARDEAESANRAKGDFLAAMSHELRTPLNAIGGYAELIELGVRGPVTEAQREDLSRIQRSQRHLLTLINDILNFAKVEAGRVEYDLRAVPLAALVASALPIIEAQLEARGLRYASRVDDALVVWADEEKLRQILLNLLSNAAKFTEAGGAITVDAARDDAGAVLLSVTDTGVGIPAEKLGAIFDPFVQAHRDLTRPTEGTGLGLAISRDLARGMSGDLTVVSAEGAGSTFTVRLPLEPPGPPRPPR